MRKINSEHTWVEAGYSQFAAEGLEGIQVERLARITGLNKSGYYHYFGDGETFVEKLMEYHLELVTIYTEELKQIQNFDPEYMELLIKYANSLMFTTQLVRNRHDKLMENTYRKIAKMVDPVLSKLFADFIGFKDYLEFSEKYFNQVRFMFHSQITFDRMNYPFLRDFMYEARDLARRAVELGSKQKAV